MAKKLTKFIAMGMLVIMALGLFAGCGGKIQHNAELHYNAQSLMKAEFLESNMTLGTDSLDLELPETRTYIIKDKEAFDLAFNEFPKEVDFSDKMVLVHFFTSSYSTSPYRLEKVSMDINKLLIEFKLNKSGFLLVPDAGLPRQTCIVVLIDKLDISAITFNQK